MNNNFCLQELGNPPMGFEEQMVMELQMGCPETGFCQDFYFTGGGTNLDSKKQRIDHQALNSHSFMEVFLDHYRQEQHEIDQCLALQSEQLKSMLLAKTKKQMMFMAKKIESKVHLLIQQKDYEIAEISKRTTELQRLLRNLETEIHEWQKVADHKRVMAVSLSDTLKQVRVGVADGELWGDNGVEEDDGVVIKPCRRCRSEKSCMVFLPCRHLNSCKTCDPYLESCLICGTTKKATIEALVC